MASTYEFRFRNSPANGRHRLNLVPALQNKVISKRGWPLPHARVVGIVLAMGLWFMTGCDSSSTSMRVQGAYQPVPAKGGDFGKFSELPKPRLGGLPYPGAFTFFDPVDPIDLGDHAYAGPENKDRGMIYTCRGGFIDIAHARKTIDLCKYAQLRFELALLNDWSAFQIKSREPSLYVVHLQYPAFWKSLSPVEKQRLARELSIRLGQRMAMTMVTWHEVLTWYGYKASGILSEQQSAFTYDDTGTHAFGVLVGGRALRESREWDQAVSAAMNSTFRELHAVTADQTLMAAQRVEGTWWSGFEPLKRHVESGLDRPVDAWIVAGLPFCRGAVPHRYQLPEMQNVLGQDFRGLVRIEIDPNVGQSSDIRRAIAGSPMMIDVDKHLPLILEQIRRRSGAQAVRPN